MGNSRGVEVQLWCRFLKFFAMKNPPNQAILLPHVPFYMSQVISNRFSIFRMHDLDEIHEYLLIWYVDGSEAEGG